MIGEIMSVSLPQFKNVKLTNRDFVPNTYDEGYDANGTVFPSVAEFYHVSKEEKEILFTLDKGFQNVTSKLKSKEISLAEYLIEIGKLNQLAEKHSKIHVELDKDNQFVVSLEAELKYEYQTLDQQKETNIIKAKKPSIFSLYAIEWEESERGWGVRPDGFSLHSSIEESEKYLKDFFARQPKEVPDEYSRPVGTAKLIEVSESLHDYVVGNGSVWLAPKSEKAYKTYDASHLTKPKNKM
jgi:hypothetical protein